MRVLVRHSADTRVSVMCRKVRVNKFNPDKLGGRVSPMIGWGLVVSMFCQGGWLGILKLM